MPMKIVNSSPTPASSKASPAARETSADDFDRDGDGVMSQEEVLLTFIDAFVLLNTSPSADQLRALCLSLGADPEDNDFFNDVVTMVVKALTGEDGARPEEDSDEDDDEEEDEPPKGKPAPEKTDKEDSDDKKSEAKKDEGDGPKNPADGVPDETTRPVEEKASPLPQFRNVSSTDDVDEALDGDVEIAISEFDDDGADEDDGLEVVTSGGDDPNSIRQATDSDGIPGDPPNPDAPAMFNDGVPDKPANPEDDTTFHA